MAPMSSITIPALAASFSYFCSLLIFLFGHIPGFITSQKCLLMTVYGILGPVKESYDYWLPEKLEQYIKSINNSNYAVNIY